MPNHFIDYCGSCTKLVARNILCEFCKRYFHVKCASINTKDFNTLKTNDSNWACFDCKTDIFPLMNANNDEFTEAFSDLNSVQLKKKVNVLIAQEGLKRIIPLLPARLAQHFFTTNAPITPQKTKNGNVTVAL